MPNRSAVPQPFRFISDFSTTRRTKPFRCSPSLEGNSGTVERSRLEVQFMTTSDFKPVNCGRCGRIIWTGITWAGFSRRLGKNTLTIEEEIMTRLTGLMTYRIYRTRISFEAIERTANRIKWATDPDAVILADHTCDGFAIFDTEIPEYFSRRLPVAPSYQEAPF